MTRQSMFLLLAMSLLVGAMTAWFLQKGLRTGTLETRFGEFDRLRQPTGFWTWAGLFAASSGVMALIALYLCAQIIGSVD